MNSLKPPLNLLRATILISTFISSGTLFSSPEEDRTHLGPENPSIPTQHLAYATSPQNPIPLSEDLGRTSKTFSHHIKENTATLTPVGAIPISTRLHPPIQRLSRWVLKKLSSKTTLHTLIGGGALLGVWLYKTRKNHLLPTHSHLIHAQDSAVLLSSEDLAPPSQKTTSEHTQPFSPLTPEPENKAPNALAPLEDTSEEAPILEAHNGYMNQEIQKDLTHLKALYYQLSDEQWHKRIAPYIGSEGSRKELESKILGDIYELFEQEQNTRVSNSYSPISRGLRAQYIFLSYIMKLENTKQKELSIKLKFKNVTRVSNIFIKLKKYLLSYRKSQHTDSLKEQYSPGRLPKLKIDFFRLSEKDLRSSLKDIVNPEVLEHINHHNLMDYLHRNFKEDTIDVFFGLFLNISPLNPGEYIQIYGKNRNDTSYTSNRKKALLKKLTHLTPNDLRVSPPHPQNFAELLQAMWLHWDEVISSDPRDLKDIQKRFNLPEEGIRPFISTIDRIKDGYHHTKLGNPKNIELKKYLLLNKITDRYHYTQKKLATLFQTTDHLIRNQNFSIKNDIKDYLDSVPLFFQNTHNLYLHQRNMMSRLDHKELNSFSMNPQIKNQPKIGLERSLNNFLKAKDLQEDPTSIILFFSSLGIPKISPDHLALILEKDPLEIQERMNQLHELWLHDHLIKSVHPMNYEDLVHYFNNLTNSQWERIKMRWGSSLRDHMFKERVHEFFKQQNKFKGHIFLSTVLKLEVISKNLFTKIFMTHHPLEEPPKHLILQDKIDSIQKTIQHKRTDLINRFESQLFKRENDKPTLTKSYTSYEELHQATTNTYMDIDDTHMRFLAHTWGFYSEEDILIFKSKLSSFSSYLLQKNARRFDIFISSNLKLVQIKNQDLAKKLGMTTTGLYDSTKNNYFYFERYLNTTPFGNNAKILSDLNAAIDHHLDQPSNVLHLAAKHGMHLHSYEDLKEQIFHCRVQITKDPTDLLIYALLILNIGEFNRLDLSKISNKTFNFIEERKNKISKDFHKCLNI